MKQRLIQVWLGLDENIGSKAIDHTQSVLTAIFPGEPGLAGCPFNSYQFIPELRIFLGQA